MSLTAIFNDLLDFLFPKADEVYELELLTPSELIQKLPSAPDLGEEALAVFAYADPRVRELVWELKYRQNQAILESFAVVLYDIIRAELAERMLFENFDNPLLIPIPQSAERAREKGFNQTELLGSALARLNTEDIFEYAPDILKKTRHTESQTTTKDKRARLGNVEGSMSASAEAKDRNIILVDDVTTTGATFAEAKRALREAGAKKILSMALAH